MTRRWLFASGAIVLGGLAGSPVAQAKDTDYEATIDIRAPQGGGEQVVGFVFEDLNRDGRLNPGEPGVPNVMVSNGKEVVLTDRRGEYRVGKQHYRPDMNIFVSKPACYELPVDENNVPQFAYIHKEHGSSKGLLFGGLGPTGRLPRHINFPLIAGDCKNEFTIAVSGDPQPRSNMEVGYIRDTLTKELAAREDIEAIIVEGDVMGDDLGLMARFLNTMRAAKAPQFLVLGNHDLDLDAGVDADSSDSFRRAWGPQYYSFTVGKVHFVVLDNVTYPCDGTDPEGNQDKRWSFCNEEAPTYTGRLSGIQLEWLKNDLAHVPHDHLIVINYHIPTVSFVDAESVKHSEDNVAKLYEILGYRWNGSAWSQGRPALALSGHTHTNDQFRPGELYEGWIRASHPFPIPFPQIIVGAASGSWWTGQLNDEQIPESYQRLGAPKGYFLLSFTGNRYKDEFKASGKPGNKQMSLSLNSPGFRNWLTNVFDVNQTSAARMPPVHGGQLGDNKVLTPQELSDTNLVVNVWNGSRDSRVWAQFDDARPIQAARTQTGTGEPVLETLDPFALRRQLWAARTTVTGLDTETKQVWNTRLGERSDGFEPWRAITLSAHDRIPLENWMWTTKSNHVWTVPVPKGLGEGVHRVQVLTIDVHGQEHAESMLFEVRAPSKSQGPSDYGPSEKKYQRPLLASPLKSERRQRGDPNASL